MADTDMSRIRRHTPYLGSDAMSHEYQAIAWNGQKRVYDFVLVMEPTLYLTLFIGVSAFLFPYATVENLDHPRALGSAAFLLLHIVLCTGRSAAGTRSFCLYFIPPGIWAF